MKFKPYEEYKKVDLPWIDKIPSHWEIDRGKNLFKQEKRKVKAEDEIITCFRDGEVTLRKNRRTTGFTESIQEIGYQGIKKGDLVIHQMDSFAGAAGVSDSDGKGSPILSICNGKILLNNYYYAFIVREMAHNGFIMSLSRGIRERSTDFRFKTFAEQLYPFPPREEQDKIVDFLDYNLAKIDKFVELTKRQIELLKEQKEVIINDSVTKGVNKNVEYKDSGIDWIGEIPAHWEITRLKYLLEKGKNNIKVGPFGSQLKNSDLTIKGKWIYNQRTVLDKNFLTNSSFISEKKYNELIGFKVEKDDILITTRGSIGRVCKIPTNFQEGVIHPCIIKFRLDEKKYNYELLEILFNESKFTRNQISILSNATTIDVIYSNTLKNIYIPLPELSEQEEIVAYIEKETSKIDRTIDLYKKQIGLIKEYRTSLIASAVTGKIDVRDF